MKIQRRLIGNLNYQITYDISLKVYVMKKNGYKSISLSKYELENMPAYKLMQMLLRNDQED